MLFITYHIKNYLYLHSGNIIKTLLTNVGHRQWRGYVWARTGYSPSKILKNLQKYILFSLQNFHCFVLLFTIVPLYYLQLCHWTHSYE